MGSWVDAVAQAGMIPVSMVMGDDDGVVVSLEIDQENTVWLEVSDTNNPIAQQARILIDKNVTDALAAALLEIIEIRGRRQDRADEHE